MTVKVTFTVEHCGSRGDRKPTIWEALAEKLGREPTSDEARSEVRRILTESRVERAERGQLARS